MTIGWSHRSLGDGPWSSPPRAPGRGRVLLDLPRAADAQRALRIRPGRGSGGGGGLPSSMRPCFIWANWTGSSVGQLPRLGPPPLPQLAGNNAPLPPLACGMCRSPPCASSQAFLGPLQPERAVLGGLAAAAGRRSRVQHRPPAGRSHKPARIWTGACSVVRRRRAGAPARPGLVARAGAQFQTAGDPERRAARRPLTAPPAARAYLAYSITVDMAAWSASAGSREVFRARSPLARGG
jgi:hypothetical protein